MKINKNKAKYCGLFFCYNEEEILPYSLGYYLKLGIDLVIFDNQSTDSSREIMDDYAKRTDLPGRIIDIVKVITNGYEWKKILLSANDYMGERLSGYRWILTIDADSIYHSPVKGWNLTQFIRFADALGYNIINGKLFDFFPTERDNLEIKDPLLRLKYCKISKACRRFGRSDSFLSLSDGVSNKIFTAASPQEKIFRFGRDINFVNWGGHACERKDQKVCPVPFLYLHYSMLSADHARKKIFTLRKPRLVERKNNPYEHTQYLGFLPEKEDLVKPSKKLVLFQLDKFQISPKRVKYRLQFEKSLLKIKSFFPFEKPHNYQAPKASALEKALLLLINDPSLFFPYLKNRLSKREKQGFTRPLPDAGNFMIAPLKEWVPRPPVMIGMPHSFHFLINNHCNSDCHFCNQDKTALPHDMTLLDFQKILSNLPANLPFHFHFSGGGEPLLNNHFPSMLEYLGMNAPWIKKSIRTNGILLEKHIEIFVKARIERLEISLHSSEMSTVKKRILNAVKLVRQIDKRGINIESVIWCAVVDRNNIEQLPEMISQAARSGFDEYSVAFRRFPFDGGDFGDSLYYDLPKYRKMIKYAGKLAKINRINFIAEANSNFMERVKKCYMPWNMMVVDHKGDIYPCTGGEVAFWHSVQSGRHNFGNLLNEHITGIWNNESYIRIRRTIASDIKRNPVKECLRCHNSLCFKGPNEKSGHFYFMGKSQ